MKITSVKTFNLIPIGNVKFSFKKRKGYVYVGELHILHATDAPIDKATYTALMAEMKKAKSDLLTDGTDFFTTRGEKITQIKHPSFGPILEADENKEKIHQLRFGN